MAHLFALEILKWIKIPKVEKEMLKKCFSTSNWKALLEVHEVYICFKIKKNVY